MDRGPSAPVREIIGVVADSKHNSLRTKAPRLVYLPLRQHAERTEQLTLAVRTVGDPRQLTGSVQRAIRAGSGSVLITEVMTLRAQVDHSLLQERLVSMLAAAFGLLALALTCIGLYGVMSYSVVRRTREIGIRTALGADRGTVLWLVLRRALTMVAIGLACGIPAALIGGRYLESLLFGLKPADPLTIGMAVLILLLVAAFAGYLPARRAARIDPMVALRYE
jgi:predicted lysophospholipase L1 biosynthesis ABC-type transport system permease subunit